jgi:hypothetical protein
MDTEHGHVGEQPRNKAGEEKCERCAGTGLVCGHTPVIGPGSCCVDYANAVCPDCRGRGVRGEPSKERNA